MDCREFEKELPNLVLTANARPSLAAVSHMRACLPCAEEYLSFQKTFTALDTWLVPEPGPYFDQKLQVRIREEQAAPKMSWLESVRARLLFNTGHNFRPLMAGALGLVLMLGGGGIAGINYSKTQQQPVASATINDLQILDHNEQAFQQMDQLQQDEENEGQPDHSVAPNILDRNGPSPSTTQPSS